MKIKNIFFFETKSKSGRGGTPPFFPISEEPDFSQTCGFQQKLANIMLYNLKHLLCYPHRIITHYHPAKFQK